MSSTTRSLKPRTLGPGLRNKPNSTRRRRTLTDLGFGNPFTALRRMINNRTSSKNNNKIFLSDESGNSKKNPVFDGVVVRNGGRKNRTKKRR
jgi:hypothetical protein